MSVFASAGQKSKHKIERVKGVLEHLSLYVGLAIYTALGAKVGILGHFNNKEISHCNQGMDIDSSLS